MCLCLKRFILYSLLVVSVKNVTTFPIGRNKLCCVDSS